MAKNILVKFEMTIGDYEHSDQYIFDKEMTEYQYCKKFWNVSKKNSNGLKTNVFWEDWEMNAISVHSIDFKDHLAYSLNNLRFSEKIWESEFMSSSGFYTNRLRYCDLKEIFLMSGFEIIKEDLKTWKELPMKKNKLNLDFINYDESDLLVKEAMVVLKKN